MVEFEIGLPTFNETFKGGSLSDKIKEFKSKYPNIKLSLYDGFFSHFSSGRFSYNDKNQTIKNIEIINHEKIPFVLVMSTGLLFDKLPLSTMTIEKEVLSFLENNAKKENIWNGVVIGHDDLLDYVKKNNPDLKTICSTIQMIDVNKFTSYEDKFQKYDLVVPLNQHTSYDFLKQFSQYKEKMLLFLNLPCYENNLFKCYEHYSNIELKILAGHGMIPENVKYDFDDFSSKEQFKIIFSKDDLVKSKNLISNYCKNIPCGDISGKSNLLYLRDDLFQLYSMGVNKFKIPREFKLDLDQLDIVSHFFKD